jgi:hypothetical protein
MLFWKKKSIQSCDAMKKLHAHSILSYSPNPSTNTKTTNSNFRDFFDQFRASFTSEFLSIFFS